MVRIFQEVYAVSYSDGVVFDPASVKVERIREQTEYGGLRIFALAKVDTAEVRVTIDIAFGDSVEPGVQEMDLPVLLDFPAPHLRAYARETVIAEKFQAMVMLGRANSRMKDLYDIWVLSRNFEFMGQVLAEYAVLAACRITDSANSGGKNENFTVEFFRPELLDELANIPAAGPTPAGHEQAPHENSARTEQASRACRPWPKTQRRKQLMISI
jgi:hypothetical protein